MEYSVVLMKSNGELYYITQTGISIILLCGESNIIIYPSSL